MKKHKGIEKKIKSLETMSSLNPDENILGAALGQYETKILGTETIRAGILCLTDQRLLFFAKKLFGYQSESIQFEKISSCEFSKGFMGHAFKFHCTGNDISLKWITATSRMDVKELHDQINTRISSQSPKAGSHTKTSQDNNRTDVAGQLIQFSELLEKGLVTKEEFENQKKRLLGA